jgi:hypothetical protein
MTDMTSYTINISSGLNPYNNKSYNPNMEIFAYLFIYLLS